MGVQTEAIKILKASPNQRNLIRRFEGKGPAPCTFLVEAQAGADAVQDHWWLKSPLKKKNSFFV